MPTTRRGHAWPVSSALPISGVAGHRLDSGSVGQRGFEDAGLGSAFENVVRRSAYGSLRCMPTQIRSAPPGVC